jgi:hypothetical protein
MSFQGRTGARTQISAYLALCSLALFILTVLFIFKLVYHNLSAHYSIKKKGRGLEERGKGRGRGHGGEMTQIIYAHMNI